MGTMNICETLVSTAEEIIDFVGRSLAYRGANGFLSCIPYSETIVAINPVWAQIIADRHPDVDDVRERIWEAANLTPDWFLARQLATLEEDGRLDAQGRLHVTNEPADLMVTVCGGKGALHAAGLHGWGGTRAVTTAIRS
jgi:hypothetical protein